MKLSNKVYDIMKWVVIIVLPAVATLYAALAAVWGWPFATEITTSITALTTFLGAILCISTANYGADAGQDGTESADTGTSATVGEAVVGTAEVATEKNEEESA